MNNSDILDRLVKAAQAVLDHRYQMGAPMLPVHNELVGAIRAASEPDSARQFTGVGQLERSGYIPRGSAAEREGAPADPCSGQRCDREERGGRRCFGDDCAAKRAERAEGQPPIGWMAETMALIDEHAKTFAGCSAFASEARREALRKRLMDAFAAQAPQPKLDVWFGAMPETNGKKNWTAILHRGDVSEGFTLARSEHHDRVRYHADKVRWIIGSLEKEPFILDYDADLISPDWWEVAAAPFDEARERERFETWAKEEWKDRSIPDNAWLGWKARAALIEQLLAIASDPSLKESQKDKQ